MLIMCLCTSNFRRSQLRVRSEYIGALEMHIKINEFLFLINLSRGTSTIVQIILLLTQLCDGFTVHVFKMIIAGDFLSAYFIL